MFAPITGVQIPVRQADKSIQGFNDQTLTAAKAGRLRAEAVSQARSHYRKPVEEFEVAVQR